MPAMGAAVHIKEVILALKSPKTLPSKVNNLAKFLGSSSYWAAKRCAHRSVILGVDDKQVQAILPQLKRRGVTYGMGPGAALRARKVKLEKIGSTFEVEWEGRRLGAVKLNVPGRFNIQNALAAVAVGLELKVPFKAIAAGLSRFHGAQRRFEIKGTYKGATVIDDYAHHPTAVAGDPEGGQELRGEEKAPGRVPAPSFLPHPAVEGQVRQGLL